jgi:8-oxo-dGTP pyrophosphatase MutT (NUDIX family)
MQFQKFEKQIVKIENLELPGEAIQLKMAPMERLIELTKKARSQVNPRKAGVMVLFYPSETAKTNLILILRKTYKGVHSAQVGFPGGKQEENDLSLEHAALRETEEEVGVHSASIMVLKKLTEIYIPPSNFFVQPYLGITPVTPKFTLQEDEVETLIEVPLTHFMDDSILITETISTSYGKHINVPAYRLNGHIVWGATAMMLSEVRELLKQLI